MEPAFGIDGRCGGFGLVPVSAHDVGAAHDHFATLVRPQRRAAIFGHDPQIDEEHRLAGRTQLGQREIRPKIGTRRRGFGEAIALVHRNAAGVVEPQQGFWHRRAAAHDDAQGRQIGGFEIRLLGNKQQHRWHGKGGGDAIFAHISDEARRIEGAVQHDMPALLPAAQGCDVEAADMEQRRHHQAHVFLGHIGAQRAVDVGPPEIAVGEHGALGPTGGARCVHDHRHVILGGFHPIGQRGGIAHKLRDRLPTIGRPIGRQEAPATQAIPYAVDHRPVRAIDHQRVHAGIIDDVIQFRAREAEVQRHEDGAKPRGGKQQIEIERVVEAQITHPVTAADAAGFQRRGQPVHGIAHLAVAAGRAFEGERRPVRRLLHPPAEPAVQSDIGLGHVRAPESWAVDAGCAAPGQSVAAKLSMPARSPTCRWRDRQRPLPALHR